MDNLRSLPDITPLGTTETTNSPWSTVIRACLPAIRLVCVFVLPWAIPFTATAQSGQRARDLGVPFDGTPGRNNGITDVPGVEVGVSTIIEGNGRLVVGKGPVRTGVTAIFPRGKNGSDSVFAGWFTLNGNGEMTGTTWVEESGRLDGPILITNTHSVGVVRDATLAWMTKHRAGFLWALPLVAETYDGVLNDAEGFHVRREHVFAALDGARSGPVPEGNVGGGTGMQCHGFKGGTGTASRTLAGAAGGYTVGVLVQCNYGQRRRLTIAGLPVGREIPDLIRCAAGPTPPTRSWLMRIPVCGGSKITDTDLRKPELSGSETAHLTRKGVGRDEGLGSIIIVIATDAPLLPHQLKRVAKRAALGVGRMGGLGEDSSGDIFIAFSTANTRASADTGIVALTMLPNDRINPIFEAAVGATEEAITNAMLAAKTMTGADNIRSYALPHDRLRAIARKYATQQPLSGPIR